MKIDDVSSQLEMWDVLCITCQNNGMALQLEKDLNQYQDAGLIASKTELVVVADPKPNIGSGGATFNAILTIAERLSIGLDYSVLNKNAMRNKRMMIMHMGRDFPFDVAGRGLFYLPCTFSSPKLQIPMPNFLHTLVTVTQQVAVGSPPGVWLTSTDVISSTSPYLYKKFDWTKDFDMIGVGAPTPLTDVANRHAAYRLDDDNLVADIYYGASEEKLRREATGSRYCKSQDDVLAMLGIVFLSPSVVELIFSFYEVYPLNSCTYMGVDSGATPIPLSILMDVMRAACTGVSLSEFVNWKENSDPLAQRARQLIYAKLCKCKYSCVVDEESRFLYPDAQHPTKLYDTLSHFSKTSRHNMISKAMHAHSFIESKIDDDSTVIVNSCIGPRVTVGSRTVIEHALIEQPTNIGAGCIISGLEAVERLDDDDEHALGLLSSTAEINIPSQISLQQYVITLPTTNLAESLAVEAFIAFGLTDQLKVPMTGLEDRTFCNMSFKTYLANKKIEETDLWPENMPIEKRTLFTAKLYPVLSKTRTLAIALWLTSPQSDPVMLRIWRSSWRLSIKELRGLINYSALSEHRHTCFRRVACKTVAYQLANRDDSYLAPIYHTSVVYEFAHQLLSSLDVIASQLLDERKLARVLANIAALLVAMSGNRGGIRSGPAKNSQWQAAYDCLFAGNFKRAIRTMAVFRRDWMNSSQALMRASRHYEGACHILIRRSCQTAQAFVTLQTKIDTLNIQGNEWVVAEAPCRADLAGGWTDTPPISYEMGGAVLNAALLINGKRPIGARIRRTNNAGIVVCYFDKKTTTFTQHWEIDSVEQLGGFDVSYSQSALVKACLYITGLARAVSSCSNPKELLVQQLATAFGSPGIEIHMWANLPLGSGLGSRSILAGVLIASMWTLSGRKYDVGSVCHAVVQCEQMMSTCAGWQDPIGGLVGGVKLATCQPELPLHLRWQQIGSSLATFHENLNRRLVMIYTGDRPPFGASLVAYNVVRNWYSNEPKVLEAAGNLAKLACEGGDILGKASSGASLDKLGPVLTQSNDLKTVMAPGLESESYSKIVELLKPISLGATVNGCGEGGFMTVLVTEQFSSQHSSKREMLDAVQRMIVASGLQQSFGDEIAVHDAEIAADGLNVSREEKN